VGVLMHVIPSIHTFKEAMFAGYFGPIGVGAIFFAATVRNKIDSMLEHYDQDYADPERLRRTHELIFPVVAFIVLSSVIVHGITIPILNLGSQIDIERLPSIASISNQVARLPVIESVENMVAEHVSTVRARQKDKARRKGKVHAELIQKSDEREPEVHVEVEQEETLDADDDRVDTHAYVDIDVEDRAPSPYCDDSDDFVNGSLEAASDNAEDVVDDYYENEVDHRHNTKQ
jgi:hypothetical protein